MTSDTHRSVPLFVDLDGTLIKTDLLAESALALVKQAPWMIFVMGIWLLRWHLLPSTLSRLRPACLILA